MGWDSFLELDFMPRMHGGVPPCDPRKIPHPFRSPCEYRGEWSNCGEEGRRGVAGSEGAGAARERLALRCPVITTQPDGPGSGGGVAILWRGEQVGV